MIKNLLISLGLGLLVLSIMLPAIGALLYVMLILSKVIVGLFLLIVLLPYLLLQIVELGKLIKNKKELKVGDRVIQTPIPELHTGTIEKLGVPGTFTTVLRDDGTRFYTESINLKKEII